MESLQEEIEELIAKREEQFDNRSEKWQESEKGEKFQEKTDRLQEMLDELVDKMGTITTLNELCNDCGFFESETGVNNGYGCTHPENEEFSYLRKFHGELYRCDSDQYDVVAHIAINFTKRKINCNRRLAKKFLKKARKSLNENSLKRVGFLKAGKCYSFSCPIAREVDFYDLKELDVNNDFDYIKSEEDMPQGFGDELMYIENYGK